MQLWSRSLRYALIPVGISVVASCSSIFGSDCDAVLGVRTTPTSAELSVGERVNVSVRLTGCGGRETLTDVITWSADDTTIVSVDNALAQVTARKPGSTVVHGVGARYGRVADIPVVVVP
jgi:hypothetical protein